MDLHDGLGPQLTGIALGLDIVTESMQGATPEITETTERLRDELDDALRDVRRLVQGLRPPRLDEVGLVESLRELAARAERGQLHIDIDVLTPIPALPAAAEVAAYRIAAEAINNVVRHANAARCSATLSIIDWPGGAALRLSIIDDGCGLNETDSTAGTGTLSMRHRAEELGGTFALGNNPERGCSVEAIIPIGAA
jgi:signal transduction histidine kinase